jgi:hypothetical protein
LENITKIASGVLGGYALKDDGTVWSFGEHTYGGRGDGTPMGAPTATPTQVLLPEGRTAVDVSAHYYGGHAVLDDGTVWGWGGGSWNMLGAFVPTANVNVPQQVPGVESARTIDAQWFNTAAILADGTVRIWGTGQNYGTGRGNGTDENGAFDSGLTNVTRLAIGAYGGQALHTDGTVSVWGHTALGENASGTWDAFATSPRKASDLQSVRDIASARFGRLGLLQR